MTKLEKKSSPKSAEKSKTVESFVLSTDRIIEIGTGSYESFENQFVGSNSNAGNMSASERMKRFEKNRQSFMDALTKKIVLPSPS